MLKGKIESLTMNINDKTISFKHKVMIASVICCTTFALCSVIIVVLRHVKTIKNPVLGNVLIIAALSCMLLSSIIVVGISITTACQGKQVHNPTLKPITTQEQQPDNTTTIGASVDPDNIADESTVRSAEDGKNHNENIIETHTQIDPHNEVSSPTLMGNNGLNHVHINTQSP